MGQRPVRIHDVSLVLGVESFDYPGDTPCSRDLVMRLDAGETCDLSRLELSAHAGTHLDAPAHFVPGGRTIDQYAVADFILPAHVVEIPTTREVGTAELNGLRVEPGDAVLFKTENSRSGLCCRGPFSREFACVSMEAAQWCVERRVRMVGIDFISIESGVDQSFPVHRQLLEHDVLILEGLNLGAVSAGRYTLVCLPLRIAGGEAAPARAVLIERGTGFP